jgi:hypothetical protein
MLFLQRILKRFVILLIGVLLFDFIVRGLYPWFDKRIPFELAIFVVYVISAYFLIPNVVRIFRLIWRPEHIPTFAYSVDGYKVDPINIGIVATDEEIQELFSKAGWYRAEKATLVTTIKTALSIVSQHPYLTAPFNNLYVFGRKQDYGFQIPVTKSPFRRHHVRFWACIPTSNPVFRDHVTFWLNKHRSVQAQDPSVIGTADERKLWVGAAIYDRGLGIIRHNGRIDHAIDANVNAERDFIIQTFEKTGMITHVTTSQAHRPLNLQHRTFGDSIIADGTIKICEVE